MPFLKTHAHDGAVQRESASPRSGVLPVAFTAGKVVHGGLIGFCLVWHEAWNRYDWHGDDALPLARSMAQQACG